MPSIAMTKTEDGNDRDDAWTNRAYSILWQRLYSKTAGKDGESRKGLIKLEYSQNI
ncbi:hypothetical protein JFL43_09450 [Viridibacillus sp. YIM B01967]|uniref:Uncharacterized protein n=1 Tax=Viridibacillus soli TaxID=2798301 RepID=A0ABS1H7S3_9BACL|nr:hypothetical protein [Viridibacillus soli]MBK3495078.1 hypothetical protein [Viridibacillus soli]